MGSEKNDSTSFPPSEPPLCANGCGFFGSPSSMNLCSKCYRELRGQEEQAASAKAAMEKTLSIKPKPETVIIVDNNKNSTYESVEPLVIEKSSSSLASSSSETTQGAAGGDQVVVPPKAANRCFCCNKKVGLTGFVCKCGSTFCGSHRYPENHNCSFDFKGTGRNAIAKANPVIKADKVERI